MRRSEIFVICAEVSGRKVFEDETAIGDSKLTEVFTILLSQSRDLQSTKSEHACAVRNSSSEAEKSESIGIAGKG